MRLFGIVLVKNEADRYLAASLEWLQTIVDHLMVFDDGSTDDSIEIAKSAGAMVVVRTDGCPPFLEDEGRCRQTAWEALGTFFHPEVGVDAVLSLDADEFLLTNDGSARDAVLAVLEHAEQEGCELVDFPVAEVFDLVGPRPMVRTDGQWAKIRATRLCRWPASLTFSSRPNPGSLPDLASPPLRVGDPTILHWGWATLESRQAKVQRYSETRLGHNRQHINSAMQPGIYEPWTRPLPDLIANSLKKE